MTIIPRISNLICLAGFLYIGLFNSGINCEQKDSDNESFKKFQNFIFISELCNDHNLEEDVATNPAPKLIVRCSNGQLLNNPLLVGRGDKSEKSLREFTKLGAHRYSHLFYHVASDIFMTFWKEIYGRLTIGSSKINHFNDLSAHNTKYPFYNNQTYKEDYWRSQWNQDEFIIKSSEEIIYRNLEENYHQLPTNLQKHVTLPPTIYNFSILFYTAISGWGSNRCTFSNISHQISELTLTYNSYDMLFCDVFKYYNLTFITNYNFQETRWIRSFLLRDDFISEVPSDPNAVFYESPGITFVCLKEDPITVDNIFRPFTPELWIIIVIFGLLLYLFSRIFSKELINLITFRHFDKAESSFNIFASIRLLIRASYNSTESARTKDTAKQSTLSIRIWSVCIQIYRIILTAAYGGMILVGIMHPSYPWTPSTFKQLNKTSNFIAGIPYNGAVTRKLLESTFTLNGISNWLDRYTIEWMVDTNGSTVSRPPLLNEREPYSYFTRDERESSNRYAVLIYNDKKFNYIYGRDQLYASKSKFVHRLETEKESVLKEMRYMSVSPGATKLHFLINAIRRCFETGSWIKWKYLESNYFKYVAPRIVQKYGVESDLKLRSLNSEDLMTTIYLWAGGLTVAAVIFCIEVV